MRDQRAAQHLLGFLGGLGHGFGDTYTASIASVGLFERALTAATGMDLCLNDPDRTVQRTCGCFGVFGL